MIPFPYVILGVDHEAGWFSNVEEHLARLNDQHEACFQTMDFEVYGLI